MSGQPDYERAGTKTVLLTLGRLPVALELARAFHASGWRVLVAEPYSMHLCRMSNAVDGNFTVTSPEDDAVAYRKELLNIVEAEGVTLVVPVSEETPWVAGLHGRLPAGVGVFAPGEEAVLMLHDKLSFARKAANAALSVPDTWAGDADLSSLDPALPVVVKPRFSCSGRGVRYTTAGSAGLPGPEMLVQQRVEGMHASSFCIARDGKVLARASYRSRVDSGSVSVCFERLHDAGRIDEWTSGFVRETGHTGFIAFDFIVTGEGTPVAIECNPRATSGIHFLRDAGLAELIAGSGAVPAGAPPAPNFLAESWSCLTVFFGALFSGKGAGRIFGELRRARDVTWSARDPWPFLLMMINTWPIIRRAMASRQTFAEVAVADLEWRADRA